jgi:hypothetical protein
MNKQLEEWLEKEEAKERARIIERLKNANEGPIFI